MKKALVLQSVFTLIFSAPQFLVEKQEVTDDECHMEYVTVWEEVLTEQVDKVICETEFKEECFTEYDQVCQNSTEPVCEMVDEMVCVDNVTNKCGMEMVLKNETYTETECSEVFRDICEYEWSGEGEERKSVPVEDSCVTKPFEECEDVLKHEENFVEEEVCRDIPIKDCRNVPKEVCVTPEISEICEDIPMEKCEAVPQEECKQITGIVPKKISKKVSKVMCNKKEGKKENEINLKNTIEIPDISDNELDGNPEMEEIPEIIENRTENTETNYEDDESPEYITEFLDIDITEQEDVTLTTETTFETTEQFMDTTENTIETTEQFMDTTENIIETTEIVEIQTNQTEQVKPVENSIQPTENPHIIQNISKEVEQKRQFDDSRIVFSDEEIDNRNKVLETRVFIDDGLLSDKNDGDDSEKDSSSSNNSNSRIFFPGQEV